MRIPKVLVRYLPQFHQIPENDKWWGKGFTEWRSVKGGNPLFSGHNQPRKPFQDNYYNLLDKETMKWQAELAKKYEIGGFSFYHYWFKDGKKILEKPAENLLQWTDIHMPFCFTWANETWARTWSKLQQKNPWADNFEKNRGKADSDGILLEQKYGREKEWREHFAYLLPFFKDSRYLKRDNKPIFVIYQPENIPCLGDMLRCWNQWSQEAGFRGLYVIGEMWTAYMPMDLLDARLIRFPNAAWDKIPIKKMSNGLRTYSYDDCWNVTLKVDYDSINGKKSYICGVVDFDTTPRKGRAGEVMKGGSIKKFQFYFDAFVRKNIAMKNDYVFLNAWNEWGEGMYLEPDTVNGYGYLEVIKAAVKKYGALDSVDGLERKLSDSVRSDDTHDEAFEKRIYRIKKENRILNDWLSLRATGKTIVQYLLNMSWHSVAVYGLGNLGQHVIHELERTQIMVSYIVDRNADTLSSAYPIYHLGSDLPNVDGIIVTPTGLYEKIRIDILNYVDYPMISLETIISESL
jgi:hypothetical protein